MESLFFVIIYLIPHRACVYNYAHTTVLILWVIGVETQIDTVEAYLFQLSRVGISCVSYSTLRLVVVCHIVICLSFSK